MSNRPTITDPAVAMALDDIRRTLSDMQGQIDALRRSRAHPLPPVEVLEHPERFNLCQEWGCRQRAAPQSNLCEDHKPQVITGTAVYDPRVLDDLPSDTEPEDGCALCGVPKSGAVTR